MKASTRDKIQALLSEYHADQPTCSAVVTMDVSSKLVLCSSEQTTISQQVLDCAADRAERNLNLSLAQYLEELSDGAGCISAVLRDGEAISITVQNLQSKEDAIVCRYSDTPDRIGAMALAKKVFEATSMEVSNA